MIERIVVTAKDQATVKTGAGNCTQNFDQNGPE
jgi:hypothetical protein